MSSMFGGRAINVGRDPKVDPQPGDLLRRPGETARLILKREGDSITYRLVEKQAKEEVCTFSEWLQWSQPALVSTTGLEV